MAHDSTVDDTDEPHTASRPRTDGGEAEAVEESDESESDNQETEESEEDTQQESADESDSTEKQQESADESDEPHEETADEPATIDADDEAVTDQTGDVGVEPQPADEIEDEPDKSEQSTPPLDGEGDTASIIQIRNQVIELSTDVIGRGLDGIIEVTRNDDHWRAVVEIIERRSVPDTQDILGQYEIELDERGEVIGYRRLEKYRRSDTGPNEH